jgi:hypothetical protein
MENLKKTVSLILTKNRHYVNLFFTSGGQGGRFLKKLPPWTPLQKLLL